MCFELSDEEWGSHRAIIRGSERVDERKVSNEISTFCARVFRPSKYADHLPLYRQSRIYNRSGLDLHRSTLAGWDGKASFHLPPIVERLAEHIKASTKLFTPSRQIATQSPAG